MLLAGLLLEVRQETKMDRMEKILNRLTKGYAFRSYPADGFESAAAYRAAKRKQLEEDSTNLSPEAFKVKYGCYDY